MSKRKPIVQTSALDAYYVGDDSDGAFYQVAKGWKGWYVTVWVEGAWTGDIATDKGPWKTEWEALDWGSRRSAAMVPQERYFVLGSGRINCPIVGRTI